MLKILSRPLFVLGLVAATLGGVTLLAPGVVSTLPTLAFYVLIITLGATAICFLTKAFGKVEDSDGIEWRGQLQWFGLLFSGFGTAFIADAAMQPNTSLALQLPALGWALAISGVWLALTLISFGERASTTATTT